MRAAKLGCNKIADVQDIHGQEREIRVLQRAGIPTASRASTDAHEGGSSSKAAPAEPA